MRRRAARALAWAVAPAMLAVVPAAAAGAAFTHSPSAPAMTVSAATLSAPTGLTATDACTSALTNSPVRITLAWAPTTSTWATNQEILRSTSSGSGYTVIATVAHTASSYVDSTVANGTTYHYRVRATRNLWLATSPTASATTKGAVLCALL